MEKDGPSQPSANEGNSHPQEPHNGGLEGKNHRYEVGPGFEIAIRAEGKQGVEVNVTKEAEHDHRHSQADKRLSALEHSVKDLAARLAAVEAEVKGVAKTA